MTILIVVSGVHNSFTDSGGLSLPGSAEMTENSDKPLFHEIIATGVFTGYLPIAPGTWGSWAAGCLLWVFCNIFSLPVWQVSLGGGFLILSVGVYSSQLVSSAARKKDPSYIVIDEFAGMFLTYALVPLSVQNFFLGFFLFRFFDITKPWPIRRSENIKNGLGIMLDDVLAGVYAALFLLAFHLFILWAQANIH